MGKYYVTEVLEVLRRAGCVVGENEITNGWQSRSRSSGGFDAEPLGVVWHHTASSTSPRNDLDYMINGSPDKPVGNVLLDRTGTFWPVAAGCANTQGKGGPSKFSRGTCPLDQGNTHLWAFEIANNGVGEAWPQVQIDAAFQGSNALNAHWHNQLDDVITHALGSGDGYTSRKIDPSTAAAVQGPWRPASANSSGSWLLADLRAECRRRAGTIPTPNPEPKPSKETDMIALDFGTPPDKPNPDDWWTRLTYTGDSVCHVRSPFDQLQARAGLEPESITEDELSKMLDTVTTVGDSPFYAGGQAPNALLHNKWEEARGRT
jgi:hypothetical protein